MSDTTRLQRIQEMLADDPNDATLRYMLAMEFATQGDDRQAGRCFNELIAATPDYVPAYMQAGRTLVRLGQDEEAKAIFTRGIAVAEQKQDFHARDEMQGMLAELE
jgi:cytochrome c-type biogenesis protein CcmH/NrfG